MLRASLIRKTSCSLLLALGLLGGCAAQPGEASEPLLRVFESEGQWLEVAAQSADASWVSVTYGVGDTVRTIDVDTSQLRDDTDVSTEGREALAFLDGMDPAFLDEVRVDLLDSERNDRVSELARAVFLDLPIETDGGAPEDGEYKVARRPPGAGTPSYGCWGNVCSCSGDIDCNNMFTYGCGGRGESVCFDYGAFLRCHCWY